MNDITRSQKLDQFLVRSDQMLGLRASALLLYGALPANLALLGVLELKTYPFGGNSYVILIACFLPVLLTFLLIRNRHKDWYLSRENLTSRSLLATGVVIGLASLISGAAGVLRGTYTPSLSAMSLHAMTNCLLTGVASLVLTSTLFLTIITKGADVPGLPSTQLVTDLSKIRQDLILIQASLRTTRNEGRTPKTGELNELQTRAKSVQQKIEETCANPGSWFAHRSLDPVKYGASCLQDAVGQILAAQGEEMKIILWRKYFDDEKTLPEALRPHRDDVAVQYEAIARLRLLKLGGESRA